MDRNNLHYFGEFVGIHGSVWGVGIYERRYSGVVGSLCFPSDRPLVIEWSHCDKHEPLCGSQCTLLIESPGDRSYIDLYTIEVGVIWLVVERNGLPYWRGCLDPEFYEEPYSLYSCYDVSLTFSDFGILKRLKWDKGIDGGLVSVRDILQTCLSACKCGDYIENTSLRWLDGRQLLSRDLYVLSSNFYDEEGESSSLYDVLHDTLLPLGFRLRQGGGLFEVSDLNYQYEEWRDELVRWSGTDQFLSVDRVYNKVRITLSPYGDGRFRFGELTMQQGAFDWDGWSPFHDMWMLNNPAKSWTSYHAGWASDQDLADPVKGFSLFWDTSGKGTTLGSGRYCYIHAFDSGDNAHCIAEVVSDYDCGSGLASYANFGYVDAVDGGRPGVVFTSSCRIDIGTKGVHCLRLTVDVLADIRYNPFFSGDKTDAWHDYFIKERCGIVLIPVEILFIGDDGSRLTYMNSDILFKKSDVYPGYYELTTKQLGRWVHSGTDDGGPYYAPGANGYWHFLSYLCYYDMDDWIHSGGVGDGWKSNNESLPIDCNVNLGNAWKKRGSGEFLPLPCDSSGRPISGRVEIRVYGGALVYDKTDTGAAKFMHWKYLNNGDIRYPDCFKASDSAYSDNISVWRGQDDLLEKIMSQPLPFHWLLFKQPVLEMVSRRTWEPVDDSDIEYSGVLNPFAEEDISIESTVGTSSSLRPTARGLFRDSSYSQVRGFRRGVRSATAEQLLIGSLFSQYASRKFVLRGTAYLPPVHSDTYIDSNIADRLFLLTSERIDCINDEHEVELTELGKEEYDDGTSEETIIT